MGEPVMWGNRVYGRASLCGQRRAWAKPGVQGNSPWGRSQNLRETVLPGEPGLKGNRICGRARNEGKQSFRASQLSRETADKGEARD